MNNACKYTPAGELIAVSASASADAVHLYVSNTGTEIPTDEHSRIFEPFYRPNNDPWKYSGTGLGLALVRKLVRNLGASIHVFSESDSTTFCVQFKISADCENNYDVPNALNNPILLGLPPFTHEGRQSKAEKTGVTKNLGCQAEVQ